MVVLLLIAMILLRDLFQNYETIGASLTILLSASSTIMRRRFETIIIAIMIYKITRILEGE